MSSWTRAIVVPLSIVQARAGAPSRARRLRSRRAGRAGQELPPPAARPALARCSSQLDVALKVWEKRGAGDDPQVRRCAEAEQWMLDRTRHTDGLGGIYPPMMYFIMALDVPGVSATTIPICVEAIRQFERLSSRRTSASSSSPAFRRSGIPPSRCSRWASRAPRGRAPAPRRRLAARREEVRRKRRLVGEAAGPRALRLGLRVRNEFYPDIDDTAMVLLALQHARGLRSRRPGALPSARAQHWLLAMQSQDGGWAAFDVDNNWELLNRVPFADHNAMLDPDLPRHHRARAGGPVPARAHAARIRRWIAASIICSRPRKRMEPGTGAGA